MATNRSSQDNSQIVAFPQWVLPLERLVYCLPDRDCDRKMTRLGKSHVGSPPGLRSPNPLRHFCSGSLALASLDRASRNLVPAFPQRSPPSARAAQLRSPIPHVRHELARSQNAADATTAILTPLRPVARQMIARLWPRKSYPASPLDYLHSSTTSHSIPIAAASVPRFSATRF